MSTEKVSVVNLYKFVAETLSRTMLRTLHLNSLVKQVFSVYMRIFLDSFTVLIYFLFGLFGRIDIKIYNFNI